MPFDQHKNLAISRVTTPPSPATTGTVVDITPGDEVRFPAAPFNVTVWPPSVIPNPTNAEVARVILTQNNRLFIERAQEGSTARAIQVGDLIAETVTAKALQDIENAITSLEGIVQSGPVALHATTHEVGGSDPIDGALALTTLDVSGATTLGSAVVNTTLIVGGGLRMQPAAAFYWINQTILETAADGVLKLSNFARNDFSLLQFGGTGAGFPALKRNANTLQVVTADNVGYASLVGESLVANTSLGFTSGVAFRSGAGTPEGVLAAPVGSLYLRIDGGGGTTLYVKETGAATNTGWVAVAAGGGGGGVPAAHAASHYTGGSDALTGTLGPLTSVTANLIIASSNVYVGDVLVVGPPQSVIKSPANGQFLLQNNAQNDFSLLQFGGTTAAFPALKRSGAMLQVRTADDGGFGNLASYSLTLGGGQVFMNAGQTIFLASGAGAPEGVVVAAIGAIWLRTDGGPTTTLYVKTSGGTTSTGWTAVNTGTKTFQQGHTWALVGDISTLTTLPGMFVPVIAGQTSRIVGLRAKLGTGSVGVQVKRNGANVGSVITVTTTAATTTLNQVLANDDDVTLVLSAPSGSPTTLSATLLLEHTA